MANGMDSDGYVVVSSVPKGFKRELARLLKSQAEGASIVGRRVTRSQNLSNKRLKVSPDAEKTETKISQEDVQMNGVENLEQSPEPVKTLEEHNDMVGLADESKYLGVASEEEQKSDVVDIVSDDDGKSNLGESTIKEETIEKPMSFNESERFKVNPAGGSDPIVCDGEEEPRDGVLEPVCEQYLGVKDSVDEVLNGKGLMQAGGGGTGKEGVEGSVENAVIEVYTRRSIGTLKKRTLSTVSPSLRVKEAHEVADPDRIGGARKSAGKENLVECAEKILPAHELQRSVDIPVIMKDLKINIQESATKSDVPARADLSEVKKSDDPKEGETEVLEKLLPRDEIQRVVDIHENGNDMNIEDTEVAPKNDVLKSLCGKLPEKRIAQVLENDGHMVEDKEKVNLAAKGNGANPTFKACARRVTRGFLKTSELTVTTGLEVVEDETGEETQCTSSLPSAAKKLEMKMSKKIELKRFPTRLKELLDTGLLEGLPVRYMRGAKAKGSPKIGLRGVIKGSAVLCFCDKCHGANVVSPVQFEIHAGSGNKRPPEYIYLENGKSLRDVLNACKEAPSDSLETVIQMATGSLSRNIPIYCLNCKASILDGSIGKRMLLCNSCLILKETQPKEAQENENHSTPTQMRDTVDRPMLSIPNKKSPDQVSWSSSARSKGKLTRKDLRMHKLVFEEDVLPDGTALAYYTKGKKLLEGYKKGFGIFCFCCNSEVSPSQFEAHAGMAARRKPFHHIFTSNGMSLHELSINLSKVRKLTAEENDDLCSICADGGDLLCCDNCPRAFHKECISLPSVPQETWYCKYCLSMFQKEKFVERNANAIAAGRVAGIDPMEQITQRCIRIVESLVSEACACVLCRGHDFSNSGFGPRTVIICDQCEKEYHVGCLKEREMDDLKELPVGKWFCCVDCNRIHSVLQNLVIEGEQKLPDLLLNNIRRKLEGKGSRDLVEPDIRWRILSGKMASDETRVLLSKAVSLFHDRFDPIADTSTSRLDLIPPMVYGRKLKDQEFGGMYCTILTVNSSVVSAGIIRIFGQEVAELPLVATSIDSEGQGYFQSLFSCMEDLLRSLNVKSLVLPSANEAESIWINKFGFSKMSPDKMLEYRKDYQMMIFQGTSVLHKSITES